MFYRDIDFFVNYLTCQGFQVNNLCKVGFGNVEHGIYNKVMFALPGVLGRALDLHKNSLGSINKTGFNNSTVLSFCFYSWHSR